MSDQPLRLSLRPARIAHPEVDVGGALLGLPIGIGAGWLMLPTKEIPAGFEAPVVVIVVVCIGLSVLAYGLGVRRRGGAARVVELDARGLRAPRRRGARSCIDVARNEIRDVALVGRLAPRVLVTPEHGPRISLPARAFVDPHGAETLVRELRRRLAELPDGEVRLRRSAAGDTARGSRSRQVPWVCLVLGVTCASGFAVQVALGAPGNADGMLALGANHPELVWGGEVHRLVTANLLHANVPHLVVNLIMIALVGPILERVLGWRRLAIVAAISAIGGSFVVSLSVRNVSTIGVSTVCMGLVGCWSVLAMRYRDEIPGLLRASRPVVLIAVLQFVTYELVAARSSFLGHMGGYLFGSLATFLVTRGVDLRELPARTSRGLSVALATLGVLVLLGVVRGVQHALAELSRL